MEHLTDNLMDDLMDVLMDKLMDATFQGALIRGLVFPSQRIKLVIMSKY